VPPPGYLGGDQPSGIGTPVVVEVVSAGAQIVKSVVQAGVNVLRTAPTLIPIGQEFFGKLFGKPTIVRPPTNEFAGPANFHPGDTGGRWAGIPGSNQKWVFVIEYLLNDVYMTHSNITDFPVSYSVTGPYREYLLPDPDKVPPERFLVAFKVTSPTGETENYFLKTYNQSLVVMQQYYGQIVKSVGGYLSTFDGQTNPTGRFDPEPIPTIKPFPTIPRSTPETAPEPIPLPLPEKETVPLPSAPPFRQPDPTPTTSKPLAEPKIPPLPFLPLPNPSTTPKPANPTNTQPQGGLVPAPISAPAVTPTTAHFIDNQKVTANGPQPTMVGITQELGRLESKLTTGARNNNNIMDDLSGLLQLSNLIKNLLDGLFDDESQKFYTITSPCETDTEGNRIEFKSTIAASSDRIGAVINRLNAIADLLQHTKNLKQPACPRERNIVTGEPVTVNFQQID
jgi:hypothetical protein